MSRLLRSENISGTFQTNNNLMQIPEVPKNNNNGAGGCRSDAGLVRSRNRSDCSESTSATSDVLSRHRQEGYSKATNTVSSRSCTSINTTTSCETEVERTPHTDSQQRLHHYRGAKSTGSIVPDMNAEQVQTEARLRRGDNSNSEWISGSTENVPGGVPGRSKYQISRMEHGSLHGLSSSSQDMLEEHETRASTESIDSEAHEYDVPTTVTETEQLTGTTDVKGGAGGATTSTTDICNAVAATSVEAVYVETDIDADETPPPSLDIVHKKDLSTDSAVYVLDEHISHHKGLNNVST